MTTNPELFDLLVADAAPVRRLRPPLVRALIWFAFAIFMLGLLALGFGLRPDLSQRMQESGFALGLAMSLLTGVLATIATFMISLPDRSRLWFFLPLPALVAWILTIGYVCLTNWIDIGPDGIYLGEAARCFATVVLVSLPLSLSMLVMLRHAAPLFPTSVAMMGSLAVAALAATALSLIHEFDAAAIVLMLNFGVAAMIIGLGAAMGDRMFSWVVPHPVPMPRKG